MLQPRQAAQLSETALAMFSRPRELRVARGQRAPALLVGFDLTRPVSELARRVTQGSVSMADEPSLHGGLRLVPDPPLARLVTQRRLFRPQLP